jgi:UPF0755 protein
MRTKRLMYRKSAVFACAALGVVVVLYGLFISAPSDFPAGAYINIASGSSLSQSATVLKEKNVIKSTILFKALVYLFGSQRHVQAGEYFFPGKESVFKVAARFGGGDFNVDAARVRVPEGSTVEDIAKLLSQKIPGFDLLAFMHVAQNREGYLFPDTYFFMPGQGTDVIVAAFSNNFSKNIAKIQTDIDAFGMPLSDVIVMASLLEREAPDTEDRRVIAGILWKRIKLGMPLQVDAVFPYIIGKNSLQLTSSDLKFDSPYNTYTHKGLPPGAIANPSLDAILAAVTPIKTEYLFYLSDRHGMIHYSATYDQHLAYREKYIEN